MFCFVRRLIDKKIHAVACGLRRAFSGADRLLQEVLNDPACENYREADSVEFIAQTSLGRVDIRLGRNVIAECFVESVGECVGCDWVHCFALSLREFECVDYCGCHGLLHCSIF